jgi:hypothetical protein
MSNFLRIQTRPDLYSVGGNINYKPDYDWNLAHGYSGTQWVTLLKLADFGPDGVLKVRWSYWAPGLNPGVDPLTIQVLDQSFTTAYYTQWLTDGYANNGFWAGGHSEAVNDYGADFESTYGLWKLTSPILGTWNYKVEYQDANDNWTSTFTSYWDGSTLQGGGAFQVVPEPLTMAGLMLGIGSLVGYVRKRRKA